MTTETDEFINAWNEDEEDADVTPEEPEVPEEPETPEEPEAPEEPETPEAPEEPEAPDYEALYKRAQNEVSTMAGRLRAIEERLTNERDELAKKVPPAPVEPDEEEQFLSDFRSKYNDEVLRAIDIMTARKARQIVDETVIPRLSPLEETTEEVISRAHFAAIEAAHPDMEEVAMSEDFDNWINTRPVHVRPQYQFVRERGTPAEVIALLDEYKSSQKSKPTPPPKEQVDVATAVPRRRGVVPTPTAPSMDDFEAAWNEAPE